MMKQASFALLVAIVLGLTSCKDSRVSKEGFPDKIAGANSNALSYFEAIIGISLPTNSTLIHSGNGGGRDANYEFFEWAIHSRSPIIMPITKRIGIKKYITLPMEDTVIFVQSRVGKKRILNPRAALGSEWQTNGYHFSGTQVFAEDGDYLVIQRTKVK